MLSLRDEAQRPQWASRTDSIPGGEGQGKHPATVSCHLARNRLRSPSRSGTVVLRRVLRGFLSPPSGPSGEKSERASCDSAQSGTAAAVRRCSATSSTTTRRWFVFAETHWIPKMHESFGVSKGADGGSCFTRHVQSARNGPEWEALCSGVRRGDGTAGTRTTAGTRGARPQRSLRANTW